MSGTIRIRAVGDVGVVGRAARGVRESGPDWLLSPTRAVLEDADLLVLNLEMPFAPAGAAHEAHVPPEFRADPSHAAALRTAVPTVACLANNHLMDFGRSGLTTTLDVLREASIATVGAGLDPESARRPWRREIGGVRVGILAYASEGPHSAIDGPGCACARKGAMLADLEALVREVDVAIVAVHGGLTYVDMPSPDDRALKHELVRAGATVVLGHHPHVWQGIERIGDGIVAHSLGEFVFDGSIGHVVAAHAADRRTRTGVLDLEVTAGSVRSWTVLPCRIAGSGRPEPSTEPDEDRRRLAELDALLDVDDYDASFRRNAGRNLVGHESQVLLAAIRRFDVRYFVHKLSRIRGRHVRLLFTELFRRVRTRFDVGGSRRHG